MGQGKSVQILLFFLSFLLCYGLTSELYSKLVSFDTASRSYASAPPTLHLQRASNTDTQNSLHQRCIESYTYMQAQMNDTHLYCKRIRTQTLLKRMLLRLPNYRYAGSCMCGNLFTLAEFVMKGRL